MTGLRSSRYVQQLDLRCVRQSLFKMCVVSILPLAPHAEDFAHGIQALQAHEVCAWAITIQWIGLLDSRKLALKGNLALLRLDCALCKAVAGRYTISLHSVHESSTSVQWSSNGHAHVQCEWCWYVCIGSCTINECHRYWNRSNIVVCFQLCNIILLQLLCNLLRSTKSPGIHANTCYVNWFPIFWSIHPTRLCMAVNTFCCKASGRNAEWYVNSTCMVESVLN